MLFEQFEVKGLSHYSYAVGCESCKQMILVDPKRDIDTYIGFAERQNMTISHVLETHIHADYASGALELATRTGARIFLSAYDKDEAYEATFPHEELRDGDAIEVGTIGFKVMHTPGHTPEHISFLVFDHDSSKEVARFLLSGDFLFVGSLGRPDLLGEDTKRQLAEGLFESVKNKLASLPDGLEVYPAHGAGSLCGSGMGGRPHSTLGFERVANPYLDDSLTKEQFIERILNSAPPYPDYYQRMKKINSKGPTMLNGLPGLQAIDVNQFRKLVESNYTVIDLRDHLSFGAGHIPGSYGIGAGPSLSVWASWVAPYEKPILLVAPDAESVAPAVRELVRVGLDDIKGYLKGGMESWIVKGYAIQKIPQLSVTELNRYLQNGDEIEVLDVRTDEEWESGHIKGARHIMGGEIDKNLSDIPGNNKKLAVICDSGYRSTVAASILQQHGFDSVFNVTGGMGAWQEADLPTT